MKDIKAVLDKAEVATVVSDADFRMIYINEKGRQLFKMMKRETSFGKDLNECHQPETMEKLRLLYQAYRERKKTMDYSVTDISGRKFTIVNVPFYENDEFGGVAVFFFEGTLA